MDFLLRPFIAKSSPSANERFETIHDLSVNFLSSSRPALTILVNIEWTFRHIQKEIHRNTSEKWILLQAHYGPNPYWTPLEKGNQQLIGATCQTLYAFNRNVGEEYVLAVVRGPDSDYPLLMHAGTTTVREAAETAEPRLKTQISSITWADSEEDIGDLDFRSILAMRKSHPSGLIINTGEPITAVEGMFLNLSRTYVLFIPSPPTPQVALKNMRLNADVDTIRPFLQDLFLDCEDLMERAFNLGLFSMQMTHIGHALLHVIITLSLSLDKFKPRKSGDADQEPAAQDARRIAFLLCGVLRKIVADANGIVKRIVRKDLCFVWRDAEEICRKLCGEYPGAVTIRQVYSHFELLRALDLVSDVSLAFGNSVEDLVLRDFFRDSISPLIKLLEHEHYYVRKSAVVAIGNLVENPEIHDAILGARPLLLKLRDDEDPDVRSAADTALRNFTKNSEPHNVTRDASTSLIKGREGEGLGVCLAAGFASLSLSA